MRTACIYAVCGCVLLLASPAYSVGTIQDVQMWSDVLGEERTMGVYLPEGYGIETGYPPIHYPVVYFLHGCVCPTYDYHLYWVWGTLKAKLDQGIADGSLQPIMAVLPDMCASYYCGAYYTNSDLNGPFEDHVVSEIVPFIDANYLTVPDRDHRFVEGHSMGGYGAMRLLFKHSDVFSAGASHAGPLDLPYALEVQRDLLLDENQPGPPYTYNHLAGVGSMTNVMFARSAAFSPNLGNPPTMVDFPFDENGDIVESVVLRWAPHSPPRLAREMLEAGRPVPRVYFDCGLLDDHLELPVNDSFADSLTALGIPYVYETGLWGHSDIQNRIPVGLSFLVGDVASSDVSHSVSPDETTMWVVPNPGGGNVAVRFNLLDDELADLRIYDVKGRDVCTLLSEPLSAGSHSVVWDGRDSEGHRVANGVYYATLTIGNDQDMRRLVRLN